MYSRRSFLKKMGAAAGAMFKPAKAKNIVQDLGDAMESVIKNGLAG